MGVAVLPRVKENEEEADDELVRKKTFVVAVFLTVFSLAVSLPAAAQNPRGSAMGPT